MDYQISRSAAGIQDQPTSLLTLATYFSGRYIFENKFVFLISYYPTQYMHVTVV